MAPVRYLVAMRDKALGMGDYGQARAITADLERMGHHFTAPRAPVPAVRVVKDPVVHRKSGRPPLPRCVHDVIASKCPECAA